jgi:hypothetical protein
VRVSEPTDGEGGSTSQNLREVLEEVGGRNRKWSASGSLENRMWEDIPRSLQETCSRAREKRIVQFAGQTSEQVGNRD